MAGRDIVVIGGSAGSIHVIAEIVRGLPPDFPGAILVVIHTAPTSLGILAEIIGRDTTLPASKAVDREKIERGRIYLAPPDMHMMVRGGRIHLAYGPKENGFRPAVDPLFRTAAAEYGPRVLGIIVSGGLDDGVQGLIAIKRGGGVTVAQDPVEATSPSMPASAIEMADVDHVLSVAAIPALLSELATRPISKKHRTPAQRKKKLRERDVAEYGTEALRKHDYPFPPSNFTCPECGGVLWEPREGRSVHYRCHVGHGYTAKTLLENQHESLEAAIWTALRALEEHAALNHEFARRSRLRWPRLSARYSERAANSESRASVIREVLLRDKSLPEECEAPPAANAKPPARSYRKNPGAKKRHLGQTMASAPQINGKHGGRSGQKLPAVRTKK